VEGCCHGELDQIYDVIGQLQEREGVTVDLLICCGDFQVILLLPATTTLSSFSYLLISTHWVMQYSNIPFLLSDANTNME
jgi:hypothetical protein